MQNPETIEVLFDGETSLVSLHVEEFHPIDPAAYQYDPGWTCYLQGEEKLARHFMTTEFFVSQSGDVYAQPMNDSVAVAPHLVMQCDLDERRWQQWEDEHAEELQKQWQED